MSRNEIDQAQVLDEQPLDRLMALINLGMEFPDAVHRVSVEHRLGRDEIASLEYEYDRLGMIASLEFGMKEGD